MEFDRHNLLILWGLPASGKSTFVKQHKLEDYCVSYDQIRDIIGGKHYAFRYGYLQIDPDVERAAHQMLLYAISCRMRTGDFIVYDNTNTLPQDVLWKEMQFLKDLCDIHDYTLWYKRFDTDVETCLKRSKERSQYEPTEEVMRQQESYFRNAQMPSFLRNFDYSGYNGLLHPQE